MAATNALPPTATSQGIAKDIPKTIEVVPATTRLNCAHTAPAGGAGVAVSASMKFCIAPEMAVVTAPAKVRWSGTQIPSRRAGGSRSESPARVSHARATV